MAVSVIMPALEMSQDNGKVIAWLKREGDEVRKGEMLLEIETDKAVVEIEAAGDGFLAGISAHAGDVVPVGRTIAWIVAAGETPPASAAAAPPARLSDTPAIPAAAVVGDAPAGSLRVSPKARRLAKEHGVDLSRVTGSGAGGEILADDILRAANDVRLKPDATTPAAPLTTIGRITAERTMRSWTTIPHFFVVREIDASALIRAREELLPAIERSHGVKVTHTDLIVSAVARTLARHPRVNSSWTADGVIPHEDVNVALGIAVQEAVVTGVVPRADLKTVGDIAVRRRDLVDRARAGRLQPDDIAGATFTISNLGMFDVDAFTAIIVPPQAAILAVGAIVDRVVPVDGRPDIRPMLTLTLSCDHRIVDGARAAEFLRDLAAGLRESQT